jgi:nitroreductase
MLTEKNGPESHRKAEYPVDRIFIDRWSPRAMSGEEVSSEELMSLFEAARWAPSSFNNQPWRFLYARRDSEQWDLFLSLLGDYNRQWAGHAAALILIISKKTFDRDQRPSKTHSFDAGAAWENLALQGYLKNLVVHGMEGFDYERARQDLKIPRDYEIEAMAAVGRPGDLKEMPPRIQQKEAVSERKKLEEIVFNGAFDR